MYHFILIWPQGMYKKDSILNLIENKIIVKEYEILNLKQFILELYKTQGINKASRRAEQAELEAAMARSAAAVAVYEKKEVVMGSSSEEEEAYANFIEKKINYTLTFNKSKICICIFEYKIDNIVGSKKSEICLLHIKKIKKYIRKLYDLTEMSKQHSCIHTSDTEDCTNHLLNLLKIEL